MPRTESRSALYGIAAAIFVSGTGIGSVLPVLPLYLRDRGASYAFVGVIVAAALLAQALGQWPAGLLTERVGRRPMIVAGLLVAALASLAFVLPLPIGWLVLIRFVQGLGFAAAIPAELAAIADVTPRERLGRAYGWVSGAQQGGFIVGPAIGGFLAIFGRWTVFIVTGVALAAAALVVLRTLKPSAHESPIRPPDSSIIFGDSPAASAVRAVIVLSLGLGLLIGIYDVVWSLYMRSIGASDLIIGLSFTLFALPLLVATPFAAWSSDKWDRRWLAFGSIVLGSLMGPIYPALQNIPLVLVIGGVEGAMWAFTEPAMNSYLMHAVRDRRGEAQGVVGTAMSSAMAIGSVSGASLFGLGVAIPFLVASGAGVLFALAAVPALRAAGPSARTALEG